MSISPTSTTTSPPPIPYTTLQTWKCLCSPTHADPFLSSLPKLELHLHLEGTLTPSLRFALAKKHSLLPIYSARLNKHFHTLESLSSEAYNLLQPRSIKGVGVSAFFEAYYGGMEVLIDEDDFFELGWSYFSRAKEMGIIYCEVMFEIQAHTRRGVKVETVMKGLERAMVKAKSDFNLHTTLIANFLRDLPLSSALEHYHLLHPTYSHLITGIGLASNEYLSPPSKFYDLYALARSDGYKLTCHCDVAQPSSLVNINQVTTQLGTTGAERIDHGLDAAQDPGLVELIKSKGTGMTLCPWAYVRHHKEEDLFGWVRTLFDSGVKCMISSDSPAYVEGQYLMENLKLLRLRAGFTDDEFLKLMRNAIEICWAKEEVKSELVKVLDTFAKDWTETQIGNGLNT